MPTLGRRLKRASRALVVLLLFSTALTCLRFTHVVATEWILTLMFNVLALGVGVQIAVVAERWKSG